MQDSDETGPGAGRARPSPALQRRVEARLDEQRRVVHALLEADEQLAGSVFERWSTCNKAGCACAAGRRHGPYYVLATGSGPGRAWVSLDPGGLAEARRLVRRHREFRKGLTRLAALQRVIAGLLRRHAEDSARRAVRRLHRGRA